MKLVIDIDEELYAAGFERPLTEKEKKIFLVAIGKGIILPNTFTFCTDAVSRQAVLDYIYNDLGLGDEENGKDVERQMELESSYKYVKSLPPVNSQEKTGHCKDCKYFEYDSVAKVDGIPLIVAHEICNKWGDGCKTREDGYCFLFEPQERSEE